MDPMRQLRDSQCFRRCLTFEKTTGQTRGGVVFLKEKKLLYGFKKHNFQTTFKVLVIALPISI